VSSGTNKKKKNKKQKQIAITDEVQLEEHHRFTARVAAVPVVSSLFAWKTKKKGNARARDCSLE